MDRATAGKACRIVLALWLSLVLLAAGTSLARNAGNAVTTTKVFAAVTAPLAGSLCLALWFRSKRFVAATLVGLALLYAGALGTFVYTVAQCPVSPNAPRVCEIEG